MGTWKACSAFCILIAAFGARAQQNLPAAAGTCEVPLTFTTVSGLKISQKDLNDVRAQAVEISKTLIDVVYDPQHSPQINLSESLSMDARAYDRAANFINGNKLLDRTLSEGENADPAKDQVNTGVEDLMERLDQLKGLNSIKVKAVRFLQRIPGSKLVIGKEPLSSYVTIKDQVAAIRRSIDAGINKMKENNVELANLSETTFGEINLLAKEIVYLQVVKEEIEKRLEDDPRVVDDPTLKDRLEIQVLARLESFAIDQKALYSTLVASTENLSQQRSINTNVIAGAKRLLNVAQPAIVIAASIRIAARDAREELAKDEAIRAHTVAALEEMDKAIIENNRVIIDLAGRSVIPIATIRTSMKNMDDERKKTAIALRKTYEQHKRDNAEFDQIMRAGQEVLERHTTGARMDLIMGGGEPPRIAPHR